MGCGAVEPVLGQAAVTFWRPLYGVMRACEGRTKRLTLDTPANFREMCEEAAHIMRTSEPGATTRLLDGRKYLDRWTLVAGGMADESLPDHKRGPWVFIQKLYAPDEGPAHTHSWDLASVLLEGEYLERWHPTERGGYLRVRQFGPGATLYRPHTLKHTISPVTETSVSLIVTSPKKGEWGFVGWDESGKDFLHRQGRGAHPSDETPVEI